MEQTTLAICGGIMIYITDVSSGGNTPPASMRLITAIGYYYWDGSFWQPYLSEAPASGNFWDITGNANTTTGGVPAVIGTLDNNPVTIEVSSAQPAITIAGDGTMSLGQAHNNGTTTSSPILISGDGSAITLPNTSDDPNTTEDFFPLQVDANGTLYAQGKTNPYIPYKHLNLKLNNCAGCQVKDYNTLIDDNKYVVIMTSATLIPPSGTDGVPLISNALNGVTPYKKGVPPVNTLAFAGTLDATPDIYWHLRLVYAGQTNNFGACTWDVDLLILPLVQVQVVGGYTGYDTFNMLAWGYIQNPDTYIAPTPNCGDYKNNQNTTPHRDTPF